MTREFWKQPCHDHITQGVLEDANAGKEVDETSKEEALLKIETLLDNTLVAPRLSFYPLLATPNDKPWA